MSGWGQDVYERDTFISIPSGKHINHSFYGIWNTYFAVEDGVLVYDHHKGHWLDPITASNGLIQYPALLVWENPDTREVWIVTPDFVFIYNPLSNWMTQHPLPREAAFSGEYRIGVTADQVVVTSVKPDTYETFSAVFKKNLLSFENWGSDSTLNVDWSALQPIPNIDPGLQSIYENLSVQTLKGGGFDPNGAVHLDNYPQKSVSPVSTLTGNQGFGEVFLGTYGAGVFHQVIQGGDFAALPFGLLSPDVMCMTMAGNQLIVGGRAGLSTLDGEYRASYVEAIKDPVLDYSFVSAIAQSSTGLLIAARGGVFKRKNGEKVWNRLITKNDLVSTRIYSLTAGRSGSIMVATERNAYLFDESGLVLRKLFAGELDWPVFDITYSQGNFYLSTYNGLFIFNETDMNFSARVSSAGEFQAPGELAAIDPIYKSIIVDRVLWASTHRGVIKVNLDRKTGVHYLSPQAPFKPRGLAATEKYIWIGSENGLFSFNMGTQAWRHYTRDDGLISNFVTDLVADNSYIWLGTNLGLTRIKWRNLY